MDMTEKESYTKWKSSGKTEGCWNVTDGSARILSERQNRQKQTGFVDTVIEAADGPAQHNVQREKQSQARGFCVRSWSKLRPERA